MARLGQTFDPSTVPADEFEPLPVGSYLAQVIDSSVADAKSGNGQVLKLTFEVLEGAYERRRHWEYLNIVHSNPDAQRIAQQSLAKLCRAVGLPAIEDSEELHFQPLILKIGAYQDKRTGEMRHVAKGFAPVGNLAPPQSKPAPQPAMQQPLPARQAAGGSKPWNRSR